MQRSFFLLWFPILFFDFLAVFFFCWTWTLFRVEIGKINEKLFVNMLTRIFKKNRKQYRCEQMSQCLCRKCHWKFISSFRNTCEKKRHNVPNVLKIVFFSFSKSPFFNLRNIFEKFPFNWFFCRACKNYFIISRSSFPFFFSQKKT